MNLKVNYDERGCLYELWRKDQIPNVAQAMLSCSFEGVIRAWHKHEKGQNDFLVVIRGEARIIWVDEDQKRFNVKEVSGTTPQLIFVPGNFWHGTQALTDTETIYFVTKFHDKKNPDELRLPPDHDFGWGKFNWEIK